MQQYPIQNPLPLYIEAFSEGNRTTGIHRDKKNSAEADTHLQGLGEAKLVDSSDMIAIPPLSW